MMRSSVLLPAPFGPVSAIRSGPRMTSSPSGPVSAIASASPRELTSTGELTSIGGVRHGIHGRSSPRTRSTVRPAGTAVPGSEIAMASSSRTASSASASRAWASAIRASWMSRDRPAVSWAERWRAPAAACGSEPDAESCLPCRSRRACLVWPRTRSRCSRRTSAAAAPTARLAAACSASSMPW